MVGLTSFVLRHGRFVVVSWAVIAIAGVWASTSLSEALSQSFTAPGRPAFAANEAIVREYGTGGVVPPLVLVTEASNQNQLARVADAVPGGRIVLPSSPGGQALGGGGKAAALVFPQPGAAAPDTNPAAAQAALESARGTGVHVTGVDALMAESGGGNAGVLIETLLGGVGALLVLAFVFASVAAFVPLLIATVSILGAFLALRALAAVTEVSFVVQFIVALIGLGVAIDYSLLMIVRWREESQAGVSSEEAIGRTMATAGQAVIFGGTTVAIGLLALVVVPVPAIRSIGYGGLLIPVVSVAASLTLLPVLLHRFGRRLDWPAGARRAALSQRWRSWTQLVVRHRLGAATIGVAALAWLALAAAWLNPGSPSVSTLTSGGASLQAVRELDRAGFGVGLLRPVEVLLPRGADASPLTRIDGVRGVVEAAEAERGTARLITVLPTQDAATKAGAQTVAEVRALAAQMGGHAGGAEAQISDLTDAIYGSFVPMLLVIVVVTFILLARAFRSVVLPLKAVALNILSVAAAFGVIVLVWQQGHGSELFGVQATGAITNWVPLAMFAFLFGLSMDYEVFILSRMRESYDEHGDTDRAVVEGLAATGRLVTSATLILFLAFVALGAAPGTEIKIFATGLAAGILIDAFVVRALIVPALVTLLGRANWHMPVALARVLRITR